MEAYLADGRQRAQRPLADRSDRAGSGELRFTRAEFRVGAPPRPGAAPATMRPLAIAIRYTASGGAPLKNVRVAVTVLDSLGTRIFATDTRLVNADFESLPSAGEIVCELPELPLAAGDYQLHLWATVNDTIADHVEGAVELRVVEGDPFGTGRTTIAEKHGAIAVRHRWHAR